MAAIRGQRGGIAVARGCSGMAESYGLDILFPSTMGDGRYLRSDCGRAAGTGVTSVCTRAGAEVVARNKDTASASASNAMPPARWCPRPARQSEDSVQAMQKGLEDLRQGSWPHLRLVLLSDFFRGVWLPNEATNFAPNSLPPQPQPQLTRRVVSAPFGVVVASVGVASGIFSIFCAKRPP